jgi:hypothetical protein
MQYVGWRVIVPGEIKANFDEAAYFGGSVEKTEVAPREWDG